MFAKSCATQEEMLLRLPRDSDLRFLLPFKTRCYRHVSLLLSPSQLIHPARSAPRSLVPESYIVCEQRRRASGFQTLVRLPSPLVTRKTMHQQPLHSLLVKHEDQRLEAEEPLLSAPLASSLSLSLFRSFRTGISGSTAPLLPYTLAPLLFFLPQLLCFFLRNHLSSLFPSHLVTFRTV